MKKALVFLAFLIICASTANSQQGTDYIIRERMASNNVPGMAYIIARNGEIIKEGYYGKSNLELNTDISDESVFAIASMSKTYTAAAVLLMAERELLSLDDPVRKYIPEAPNSWDLITIKHLLTHSSGLVDDWGLYDWNTSNALFLSTQTDSAFLEVLFAEKLKFAPGTDIYYSSGPFVLGVVIERITGEYYGAYLQKAIFDVLSLKETWVDDPYRIIPNRVSGYFSYDTSEIDTRVSGIGNGILIAPVSYGRADVGIRTTARDLLKFYQGLLNGDLLNEASMKIMFSPSTLDDGGFIPTAPGWMNWPLAGKIVCEHSGGFRTGFSSQAFVIPKDKFIVILLSNLHGGVNFSMAQKIASQYYPDLEPLSKKPHRTDENPQLTTQHLRFLKELDSIPDLTMVNEVFPFSYYSQNLRSRIANTQSLQYLDEKNVEEEDLILFEVSIHKLRQYQLLQDKPLYTTVYLDQNDKLVFMDYPETE